MPRRRSPRLAHKAPVMQAKDVEKSQTGRVPKVTMKIRFPHEARHFILLTLTFNSC